MQKWLNFTEQFFCGGLLPEAMRHRVSQACPFEMRAVVRKLNFRALQHLTMRKPIRNMR